MNFAPELSHAAAGCGKVLGWCKMEKTQRKETTDATTVRIEHTKFMRELFEKNPRPPQDQKEARAIWWDKNSTSMSASASRRRVFHRKATSISAND